MRDLHLDVYFTESPDSAEPKLVLMEKWTVAYVPTDVESRNVDLKIMSALRPLYTFTRNVPLYYLRRLCLQKGTLPISFSYRFSDSPTEPFERDAPVERKQFSTVEHVSLVVQYRSHYNLVMKAVPICVEIKDYTGKHVSASKLDNTVVVPQSGSEFQNRAQRYSANEGGGNEFEPCPQDASPHDAEDYSLFGAFQYAPNPGSSWISASSLESQSSLQHEADRYSLKSLSSEALKTASRRGSGHQSKCHYDTRSGAFFKGLAPPRNVIGSTQTSNSASSDVPEPALGSPDFMSSLILDDTDDEWVDCGLIRKTPVLLGLRPSRILDALMSYERLSAHYDKLTKQ
ncbi:uncharacterized protein LOC126322581 isoform X2 [Schistocerca gregaria]|nr:uncharacterized protein LOC126322581 isoform X2 [Schistocerca gregaria]